MKKKNAAMVLIVLILFTAFAWVGTVKGHAEDSAAYNEHIEKAEDFEAKGIYIDALAHYESALELNPKNYDLVLKIADMYYELGDFNGFLAKCDEAIALSPEEPTPYINKANYYVEKMQYTEALKILNSASRGAVGDNKQIRDLQAELSTKCIEKYVSFASVSDWHVQGDENYVAVEENGRWGLTQKDGTRQTRLIYEYVGAYDAETGVIPCRYEGVCYYMDLNGNKKLMPDNDYQMLGAFGCGLAPAEKNGVYGYIDADFNESNFEYEYAGAFANNVAAVKKDGKWGLINSELEPITGFDYDKILMDSNDFCSAFDLITVCRDGRYFFIDHAGETVGSNTFDEAARSASNDSYIAVKVGEKWGFADQSGEIVIEPQYEGAKSFSLGLAPIEIEDRWGYINISGEVVIEASYHDAGVFSADGSAPVKNSVLWNFLVLCEYDE